MPDHQRTNPASTTEDLSYGTVLKDLQSQCPRLAQRLFDADKTRTERTALMREGVRFAGLDELLLKLDEMQSAWASDPQLANIAFLITRATAAFETAVEAGLSGFPAVAADAMRDVMEIELLLLDFYLEPSQIDAWLNLPPARRRREFSPARVRGRVMRSGLAAVASTTDINSDYSMHSEMLHVNPRPSPLPFMRRGYLADNDILSRDASFIEIFEHARRVGNAALLLAARLSPESVAEAVSRDPLPKFALAHSRTQDILRQFMTALAEASEITT